MGTGSPDQTGQTLKAKLGGAALIEALATPQERARSQLLVRLAEVASTHPPESHGWHESGTWLGQLLEVAAAVSQPNR